MCPLPQSEVERNLRREVAELKRELAEAQETIRDLRTFQNNHDEQYRVLFETTHLVTLMIDPDTGAIVDANQAACRFYGYDKPTLLSLRIHDINTQSDEIINEQMQQARKRRQPFLGFRHRLANGETCDVEVYSGPIQLNGNTLLYSIIYDVTERNAEIAQLRLLWQAINQSVDNIMITDSSGRIEYVNPSFTQRTGYALTEVHGKTLSFLNSGNTAPNTYAQLRDAIESGKKWSGEFTNKKKNGEPYWERAMITPVRDSDDKITHFVAIQTDITEQKLAWKALEQKELILRRSQAIAQVGNWVWNSANNEIQFSDELYRIFGIDPAVVNDDLIDAMIEAIHPDDRETVLTIGKKVMRTGQTTAIEFRVIWPDGSIRFIWAHFGESMFDDTDQVLSLSGGIIQDITDRKQIEIQLQEAEQFARFTVNALSAHIAILDGNGSIIAVNEAWRAFAAANADEDLVDQLCEGANYLDVLAAVDPSSDAIEDARTVANGINRIIHQENDRFIFEYFCPSPEHPAWFLLRITRFTVDGSPRIVIAHEDITERKLAEKAAEEQRALAVTLRETITILTGSLEPEQVMHHILDNLSRVVPHTAANIMIIEENYARVLYAQGYTPQQEAQIRETEYPLNLPTFAQILSSREPVLVNNREQNILWRMEVGPKLSTHSYLGAPILIKGQVLGFINLDSNDPNNFRQVDSERLMIFAEQAAIAIQNAQMYDSIARTAEQLSKIQRATELLFTHFSNSNSPEAIGAQAARVITSAFGLVDAGIILYDPNQKELIRLHRSLHESHVPQPLFIDGPGLVPEAIRTGQTIYVSDVAKEPLYVATFPDTRTELVIPLYASQQVIGVLDIQSPLEGAFSDSDQRALHAVAQHAATAIENVRLYAAISNHAEDLKKIVDERTAQLSRVNDRVTTILNNTSDAIILVDEDNRIENTNLAFDRTFDYEHDSLFGEPLQILVLPEWREQLLKTLDLVRKTERPHRLEISMHTKHGKAFDSDLAIAYIRGNGGNIVCSIRDITHLKEIERVKDQFVSMVSHELRTPISSIMLSSSSINKYFDRMTRDQKLHKLQTIYQQAATLTDLVTSILDVSRLDARKGKRGNDRVDVSQALNEAVTEQILLAREKEQTLDIEVHNHRWIIEGEHFDITRVWRNLLSNAIKYTDQGGKIKVSLYGACIDETTCEVPDLSQFTDQIPENLDLSKNVIGVVEDDGHGIRPEDMPKLFTRFFRGWATATSITGTGLGLSLVRDLLQLYGGDIAVRSELGVGTAFCFWLPINDKQNNS